MHYSKLVTPGVEFTLYIEIRAQNPLFLTVSHIVSLYQLDVFSFLFCRIPELTEDTWFPYIFIQQLFSANIFSY